MSSSRTLWIGEFSRARHQLCLTFGVDALRFNTVYWYDNVDLLGLEQKFGQEFMNRVYFHIAAFEANKLGSLAPERLDLRTHARYHTREFERLWRTFFCRIWAQWRYENGRPDYQGPEFITTPAPDAPPPTEVRPGDIDVLAFFGGGKDSLLASRLLEDAGIPYGTFVYSSSVYGASRDQHTIIERLRSRGRAGAGHRQWVFEDFLDCPVLEIHPELDLRTLSAGETPSSVFGVLPIVLEYGYTYLCLGHERSADRGNLTWSVTGEDVNHQWGKSSEAEGLLNTYLREALVRNVTYFSVLKPIYDVVIFNMLNDHLADVPYAHSCNVRKPWCNRCPKCAYIWLNYCAHLPSATCRSVFSEDLFALPENQLLFRQMLGLEEHTPFECIGQIPESRLAFELCLRKGASGAVIDMYRDLHLAAPSDAVLNEFLSVQSDHLPEFLRDRIGARMLAGAHSARRRIVETLGFTGRADAR